MSLLSSEMEGALNTHLGRELGAHVQYLALSAHFSEQGLIELTRFFRDQAAEEHDHAMRFFDYVLDAGGAVAIPDVPAPPTRFPTAEAAVEAALASEMAVTGHINDLVDLARAGSDHATEAFLHWFVTEQVEEVSTMTELLQVVRRAGEGGLLLVEDYVARKRALGTTA